MVNPLPQNLAQKARLQSIRKPFMLQTLVRSRRNLWRVGLLPDRLKNFLGTAGAVPSDFSPNEFGAQKFRHQPLAEASGMSAWFDDANDTIKGKSCYGLQPVVDDETPNKSCYGFQPVVDDESTLFMLRALARS